MKTISLFFLGLFLSHSAMAESGIDCKISGGAEQALSVAPKEFHIGEAGEVMLYADGEMKMSLEVGDYDSIYYGNQAIKVGLAARKKLASNPQTEISGIETFSIKGCDDADETTAEYSFSYKKNGVKVSTGTALYSCSCSLD